MVNQINYWTNLWCQHQSIASTQKVKEKKRKQKKIVDILIFKSINLKNVQRSLHRLTWKNKYRIYAYEYIFILFILYAPNTKENNKNNNNKMNTEFVQLQLLTIEIVLVICVSLFFFLTTFYFLFVFFSSSWVRTYNLIKI